MSAHGKFTGRRVLAAAALAGIISLLLPASPASAQNPVVNCPAVVTNVNINDPVVIQALVANCGFTGGQILFVRVVVAGCIEIDVLLNGVVIRVRIGNCPAYPLAVGDGQTVSAGGLTPTNFATESGGGFPVLPALVAVALALQVAVGAGYLRRRATA